jgi:hypothetical protein
MTNDVRPEHVASFLIGLAGAIALNRFNGWWLDSGRGVGITLGVLFGTAFLIAYWRTEGRVARAFSLWAGSLVGMTMFLFWVGPGTIWPIVLVIGGGMTAAPVLAGAVVAAVLEWLIQS